MPEEAPEVQVLLVALQKLLFAWRDGVERDHARDQARMWAEQLQLLAALMSRRQR